MPPLLQGLVNKTTQKPSPEGVKIPSQPVVLKAKQSSTRRAVDISTVEKLLIPPPSQSSQNLKAVTKGSLPELRRLPSVNPSKTQDKIDQLKKPINSTISKLQALSASGIGAAHPTHTRLDNSDLKSVLDRLDSDEESGNLELVPEQAVNKKVTAQPAQTGKGVSKSVDEQMDSLFAKIAPTAKPEISRTDSLPEIKTQSLAENKEEPRLFKNRVDNEIEEIFSSMVPPAEAQREVSKAELDIVSRTASESQSSDAASGASLFGQPIDKEMDSIFAKIAPQAKPEIGKTESLPESKSQPLAASKKEPRLFKEKVDTEVDEIFSGMAPAEAQKEVSEGESRFESKAVSPSPDATSGASLFGQPNDKEMDSIFAKMAPQAKPEISRTESLPESKSQPLAESKEEPRLFKDQVDDQVEEIFSGMVSAEAQKEVKIKKSFESNKASALDDEITGDRSSVVASFDASVSDQKTSIPDLKDFGRLSSRASAERESNTQAGTMKTIGKLLIDSDAVENIIKKAESGKITINLPSAKVISQVRGQGIQNLLDAIDNFDGVEGSMLVGEDGLVILSTLTSVADRDGTGVLAYGMLGNSNIGTQKLDLGELEQMILITNTSEGKNKKQLTTVFTDVEVGVLAVFIDVQTIAGLDNLIEKISSIANG